MTDQVREQVLEEMQRKGINRQQLAEMIDMNPQYLWDMLAGKRSNIPQRWQDILDALGLEIVVQPKRQREQE
ncbi:helix-turn-helix domain-containing protein [Deinococcus aetherius]|nr:helix-turn-helix transcriptional regulator [Deinococcus aetherius]